MHKQCNNKMAIETLHTLEIIEVLENFLERKRPKEEFRDKVDISYHLDKQSVMIYEIRPRWNNPEEIMELPIAKATFVVAKDIWKVYWRQSDQKWHSYTPEPTVDHIQEFVSLVEQDEYYCFWG
ncbi:DUF3024 domain-containing protein [Arcticibacter eurypsychrophilus]|uniref:DUF3024 domain-containing protein n=1 Tax=Arcticibacter eurypsychrophilus TaxID=1434752 RepID=UPI0009F58200|nr:DUF3024 domain-containing protein [Arcticibacter eurypsychrophilus]